MSYRIKNPTKKEVLQELQKLSGRIPIDVDLGLIMDYFRPGITAKKDDYRWLCQAIPKKVYPYQALGNVLIDDGYKLACDTHRIHRIKTTEEHGQIGPDGKRIDSDKAPIWPQWKQVWPDDLELTDKEWQDSAPITDKNGKETKVVALQYDQAGLSIKINAKYYREAVAGMDNPKSYIKDNETAVVITDGKREALIMPIHPQR